ncbi:hypothetical protein VOLCADRAFT_106748 [Volvox carteri f. nagariensis]|uniref:Uncharacterized protein n=1 Tax=Volvox carteri f. nagariensis TaxID=3068 RepID=D8U9I1_VOLCA|nr:uncharacterized protein VOLCADRAFT_106748 [Volvox carteri f. nagariensis]EFJ43587.1 hypothetical protein VOLCADRAFT_106748 [Volvox carteri f. nagariensis]|eukprot:XP_002955287.1 hypothetical protein VOLCADRAFT_106748 [Volvox carteri f. nagariensis]
MVSCPNNPPRLLSPRPTLGPGLRGVTKQSASSRFASTKNKKAQRALCTIFEDSALSASSPLFTMKAPWSPGGRTSRRNNLAMHPTLGRLRLQELLDAPKTRKATPIKERQLTLCAAFGRQRMHGDLDALADELGTCQLQSVLKPAAPQPHSQANGALELQPLVLMQDD